MKDLMKILRHQKYPYNLLVNDLRASKSSLSRLFTVALEYQVMQWQKRESVLPDRPYFQRKRYK